MIGWLRTVATTAWRSLTAPTSGVLRAPTAADLVRQPPGTLWCAPACAVTMVRVLTGRPGDLAAAQRDLLGTWEPGGTSVEALASWLDAQPGIAAALIWVGAPGAYEAIRQACRGGAYAVPMVWSGGRRGGTIGPETHSLIVYGAADGEVHIADPLIRADRGHWWRLFATEFESGWCCVPGRGNGLTPIVFVRRR